MRQEERLMIGLTRGSRRNGAHLGKDLALIPPRVALGATMLYHGLDKLRGSNRAQSAQAFESMGIRPGHQWSRATGIAETAAGVLSLLGTLTRPAALAVLVTQGVAVAKVHARRGFAVTKGGYEFNLALLAIATAILIAGPGRFSTHGVLERATDRRGQRGFFSRLVRLVK
jgi:putative oxidoreductase